jgi:cytochrome c oxidase subunit 2
MFTDLLLFTNMTAVLLITGGILALTALALIYRVLTLAGIAKGNQDKPVGLSNKVNAVLFPLFFFSGTAATFWYSGEAAQYFLPEAASVHGVKTDTMFWIAMAVISFAFFATNLLLFWFSYQYRYNEKRKALFYADNHKLELIWTVIPAIVMAGLVSYGAVEWTEITSDEPEGTLPIEIMGKQFNWEVRYPGADRELGKYDYQRIDATNSMGVDFTDPKSLDDFMPREIHLPKGQNVVLKIRSRDVLHSVFLPHFRVKMDAVPGLPTKFWFTPTISTQEMRDKLSQEPAWQEIDPKTKEPRWKNFNYELACTEVCGNSHFAMRFVVVVDEPEDFEKWYAGQEAWAKGNASYLKEKYNINVAAVENVSAVNVE